MIPSWGWKTSSGWINYSGKVISHKIRENEMDYRGSKSVIPVKALHFLNSSRQNINNDKEMMRQLKNSIAVKEQRVDGSYIKPMLRYTLTGFERNYQVKILSKQLNKLFYL